MRVDNKGISVETTRFIPTFADAASTNGPRTPSLMRKTKSNCPPSSAAAASLVGVFPRAVGLALFTTLFCSKTHSIDDSQYSTCNQPDTWE
jgi:hypothetical protein